MPLTDKVRRRRDQVYLSVRACRPDLYQRAIQVAEMVAFNHQVSLEVAADIEYRCMAAIAEALEV